MSVKITFIHHSSFMVETENNIHIFDYFKGIFTLPERKKVNIFSSHSHPDHYSTSIYDISKNANYILSEDIEQRDMENIHYVNEGDVIEYPDFKVYCYGSTDEGVSFVVEEKDLTIFHAGDLNDWYWEGEMTEYEAKNMRDRFTAHIDKISSHNIDICFFPVDSRQRENSDLGGSYALEKLRPKHFFPMHLWYKYEYGDKFKEKYKDIYKDTKFYTISDKNQEFEV